MGETVPDYQAMEQAAKVLLYQARKVERGNRLTEAGCAAFDRAVEVLLGAPNPRLGEISDPIAVDEIVLLAREFARDMSSRVFEEDDLARIRRVGTPCLDKLDGGAVLEDRQRAEIRARDETAADAAADRWALQNGAARWVTASLHLDPFTGLLFGSVVNGLVRPVHEIGVRGAVDRGAGLMKAIDEAAQASPLLRLGRHEGRRRVRNVGQTPPDSEPTTAGDVPQALADAPKEPVVQQDATRRKMRNEPRRPQAGGAGGMPGV
ncbi:hypothetical protein [Streptomyces sp. NPDC057694]|uniref:hypothetical protein n=1 Tax=Streptomyces sp. NPDC057694 TaxID=3346216 RepID=UPI0036753AAF